MAKTPETEQKITQKPMMENKAAFDSKALIEAYDAGAKGQYEWLEKWFNEQVKVIGPNPIPIDRSQKDVIKQFQNGLGFLVDTRQIELDEFMAKPSDSIRTSLEIAGLISGLRLDENGGVVDAYTRADEGFIQWARRCREGYAIGMSLCKDPEIVGKIHESDGRLKTLIEKPQVKDAK